jgi:hypothetical protein
MPQQATSARSEIAKRRTSARIASRRRRASVGEGSGDRGALDRMPLFVQYN